MNNHCSSNRSTPISDKGKNDEDDNGDVEMTDDARDNGDRCSVNSSNVNNNSVSTRTMAEELALKDKEVRKHLSISINYSPALLFVRCLNFHSRSLAKGREICENFSSGKKQFILQTRKKL